MRLLSLKLLFNTVILFAVTSCSSQSIIYEPIGLMDKPLPTIEITSKITKKDDNYKRNFTLDKKDYTPLQNYILNNVKQNSKNEEYEYGSYKIICIFESKKIEYIINSKKESILFFEHQLPLLVSNKLLEEEIKTLLKRLK